MYVLSVAILAQTFGWLFGEALFRRSISSSLRFASGGCSDGRVLGA
jgi:hypothetical protein